jgi:hypothetical protein
MDDMDVHISIAPVNNKDIISQHACQKYSNDKDF